MQYSWRFQFFISPLPRLLTPGNSIQYIMLSGAMGIPTQFSDLYLNKSGLRSPAGPQLGVASCWRERERERDATVTKVPTSHHSESGPFSLFFPRTYSEWVSVSRCRAPPRILLSDASQSQEERGWLCAAQTKSLALGFTIYAPDMRGTVNLTLRNPRTAPKAQVAASSCSRFWPGRLAALCTAPMMEHLLSLINVHHGSETSALHMPSITSPHKRNPS